MFLFLGKSVLPYAKIANNPVSADFKIYYILTGIKGIVLKKKKKINTEKIMFKKKA